jgi:hypothetical protein
MEALDVIQSYAVKAYEIYIIINSLQGSPRSCTEGITV